MHETELVILGLCVATPLLSVIARLLDIPYPQDSVERLRRVYAFRRRRFATLRGELEDEDGIVDRSLA